MQVIAMYIAFQYQLGYAYSTIVSSISAISFMNQLWNSVDNTKESYIVKLLQGVKNVSTPRASLLPIGIHLLEAILGRLPMVIENIYDVTMFRALFLSMYYCCLRVSEVALSGKGVHHAIQIHNVSKIRLQDNSICIILKLCSFKFSKGRSVNLLISPIKDSCFCPVNALMKYLELRPRYHGQLFVNKAGRPLQRGQICDILKLVLTLLNVTPVRYNTHSFRIGRATDLALKGMFPEQIRVIGRWSSDAYLKYVRPSVINCVPHDG